jgi:hypothetical protein
MYVNIDNIVPRPVYVFVCPFPQPPPTGPSLLPPTPCAKNGKKKSFGSFYI